MTIFTLLGTAFSCVFYGMVATMAVMALLYVVLKSLIPGAVRSIPFYMAGVVLAILLVIQFSLLIGAVEARGLADSVEITVNQMVEGMSGTFGVTDSQQLLDALTERIPLLGVYVDTCDFSGQDTTTIAASMASSVREYLSSYIWHRIWWILAFVVVACVIAMSFDRGMQDTQLRSRGGRTTLSHQSSSGSFRAERTRVGRNRGRRR